MSSMQTGGFVPGYCRADCWRFCWYDQLDWLLPCGRCQIKNASSSHWGQVTPLVFATRCCVPSFLVPHFSSLFGGGGTTPQPLRTLSRNRGWFSEDHSRSWCSIPVSRFCFPPPVVHSLPCHVSCSNGVSLSLTVSPQGLMPACFGLLL